MRNALAAAMFLWLTPVLAVAAGGVGLARTPAIVVGAACSAMIAVSCTPLLHRRLAGIRLAWPFVLVLTLASAVAILRIGTLSIFMADASRTEYSVEPQDPFRRVHSCLSAYAEAAR